MSLSIARRQKRRLSVWKRPVIKKWLVSIFWNITYCLFIVHEQTYFNFFWNTVRLASRKDDEHVSSYDSNEIKECTITLEMFKLFSEYDAVVRYKGIVKYTVARTIISVRKKNRLFEFNVSNFINEIDCFVRILIINNLGFVHVYCVVHVYIYICTHDRIELWKKDFDNGPETSAQIFEKENYTCRQIVELIKPNWFWKRNKHNGWMEITCVKQWV